MTDDAIRSRMDRRASFECRTHPTRGQQPPFFQRGWQIGYPFATTSENDAFCLFERPRELDENEAVIVTNGYLIKDGIRQQIARGWRRVERDQQNGWIERLVIECNDEVGRNLVAEGNAVSRMFIPSGRGVTVNTLLEWSFNGVRGWGEDQSVWRNDQWSAARQIGFNEYRP